MIVGLKIYTECKILVVDLSILIIKCAKTLKRAVRKIRHPFLNQTNTCQSLNDYFKLLDVIFNIDSFIRNHLMDTKHTKINQRNNSSLR